ncbi:hypothetical protein D3C75_561380 [compost metagenome]
MGIVVHGKHFAGTGKTALHLVGNHHDAVGVTNLANSRHKFRRSYVKTAFALDRLEDDRGNLRRFNVRFEQALDGFHRIFGGNTTELRRIRRMEYGAREWAKANFIGSHFARQRHRHIGAAMESAAKSNHAWATGMGSSDFHGIFNGFSAGGEKRRFLRANNRGRCVNFFRQRDITFVRDNLISGVGKRMKLLFDGLNQARVAMAGIEHRNARSKIDILLPFDIGNGAVFSRLRKEITHHAHATRSSGQATLVEFVIAHFFIPHTKFRFTG